MAMDLQAPRTPPATDRKATNKRARTRQLVLQAAMDCVRDKGIAAATASEIAQSCGLSWGVIQYHFGDRDGLFFAILEEGYTNLRNSIGRMPEEQSIAERVASLVDATWVLLRHADYRVFLEIQLHLARHPGRATLVRQHANEKRRGLQDAWIESLPECDPTRVELTERLAIMSLRGLGLERAVNPGRNLKADIRQTLIDALLHTLAPDVQAKPQRWKHALGERSGA